MKLHPGFLKVLQSLYKDNTVKVSINGHYTDDIRIERGIKQGCVLSPLLFLLYISDLAAMIEQCNGGIKINTVIVSGLLFMDDLILISKSKLELLQLMEDTQTMLEELGMNINVNKSNILFIYLIT